MPHFGLIPDGLPKREDAILRAKLHYRGGMLRLERGQTVDGIAAMYDALSSALLAAAIMMEDARRVGRLDDRDLFLMLKESGRLGESLVRDFDYVSETAERAMELDTMGFDRAFFVDSITNLLTQLSVLPIVDGELPEDESSTQ